MPDATNLDDWDGFFKEIEQESPRAALIIAAAFLDGWLKRLLTTVMVDAPNAVDALLGTEDDGDCPLSHFSARIKAAYCLGLLTKDERDDLNLIRSMRNRFAHRPNGFFFEDTEIVDWCHSLKTPMIASSPRFPKDHGSKLLAGIAILAGMLSIRTKNAEASKRPKSPTVIVKKAVASGATRR